MQSEEEAPTGFVVDYFARWAQVKESLFVERLPGRQKDDSMSTSYQEQSALVASRAERVDLEELEVLLMQFTTKERETTQSLNALAQNNSSKLKNVFGRTRESETFLDLTQEITTLNGILEQAALRKKAYTGSKRGEILENITRHMTAKISQLIARSSGITEKFRSTLHRANTLPDSLPGRRNVQSQLKLILEHQVEDEEALERRELHDLTRAIGDIKAFMLRLSDLAVEQGAVIDRIDVNLKQTVATIDRGNKNLIRAIEHQENRCISTVIKLQIGAVFLLFVLLLIKYTGGATHD